MCAAALGVLGSAWLLAQVREAPLASGARILLLPRQVVSGERATLAVLDVNGRLTPGVKVRFSNGDQLTTDLTGRALFVAPLNPGVILGSIEGRAGHVPTTVLTPAEGSVSELRVNLVPRVASLDDRFEMNGAGFCADADLNEVRIGGAKALVLASSPASLVVLPPAELAAGPAQVDIACAKRGPFSFSMVFVSLELAADRSPLGPREHRALLVKVRGTQGKVQLEARNLSPDIADLTGGNVVRAASSGGSANAASFELVGKKRGSFLISIRLVPGTRPPR